MDRRPQPYLCCVRPHTRSVLLDVVEVTSPRRRTLRLRPRTYGISCHVLGRFNVELARANSVHATGLQRTAFWMIAPRNDPPKEELTIHARHRWRTYVASQQLCEHVHGSSHDASTLRARSARRRNRSRLYMRSEGVMMIDIQYRTV